MPRRSLRSSAERALLAAWYQRGASALSTLLLPLAAIDGLAVALRRSLYRRGLLHAIDVGVPVVVVGNLTVGGTGKTPLVRHLVAALAAEGRRPGIVSRGHGGRAARSGVARCVNVGDDPAEVGDEPLLYVADGFPVAIAADRVAAARALLRDHPGTDVVVADDGLQHYRLARDVELVVIDGERGFGNGRLLPAGPLREPLSRLGSVDAIVVNGDPARALQHALAATQPARAVPVLSMRLVPGPLRNLADPARHASLPEFRGRRVRAIAGIGNPGRFFAMLQAHGLEVRGEGYPDHHRFVAADLAGEPSVPVLMTEKDAVKCRAFADQRCWEVPVSASLEPPLAPLVQEKLRGSQAA